jgi:hypothetical protein
MDRAVEVVAAALVARAAVGRARRGTGPVVAARTHRRVAVGPQAVGLEAVGLEAVGLEAVGLEAVAVVVPQAVGQEVALAAVELEVGPGVGSRKREQR